MVGLALPASPFQGLIRGHFDEALGKGSTLFTARLAGVSHQLAVSSRRVPPLPQDSPDLSVSAVEQFQNLGLFSGPGPSSCSAEGLWVVFLFGLV